MEVSRHLAGVASVMAFILCMPAAALGQPTSDAPGWDTAEGVVTELYSLVTFEAGTTPDWDRVRALFLPQATVVLRTSRETTTVFSLEGFVQDFVDFITEL